MSTDARSRILDRIRAANTGRDPSSHPGDFEGWRVADAEKPPVDGSETAGSATDPVGRFVEHFTTVGGEVVRVADRPAAAAWLADFCSQGSSIAVGLTVPDEVVPAVGRVDAAEADIAISRARACVAETGSLMLDARDGRRTQLLVDTHVVLVDEDTIGSALRDVLRSVSDDLPGAIGLHSGPSKSADIGQVMVKGVHGPGRLIALLVGASPDRGPTSSGGST